MISQSPHTVFEALSLPPAALLHSLHIGWMVGEGKCLLLIISRHQATQHGCKIAQFGMWGLDILCNDNITLHPLHLDLIKYHIMVTLCHECSITMMAQVESIKEVSVLRAGGGRGGVGTEPQYVHKALNVLSVWTWCEKSACKQAITDFFHGCAWCKFR